jgi:hypothetical protein
MTDTQKSDGAILKTDTKGRVRTPAARRESLLDEFERSGLSGTKFAALAGITYQTFAAWAARLRKQGVVQAPRSPRQRGQKRGCKFNAKPHHKRESIIISRFC